jgi:hypothetical protein
VGFGAKVKQGGQVGRNLEDDIPSLAAVAAVRTAERDELFPPEGDAAGAARARFYLNFYFIDEFHRHLVSADKRNHYDSQKITPGEDLNLQASHALLSHEYCYLSTGSVACAYADNRMRNVSPKRLFSDDYEITSSNSFPHAALRPGGAKDEV